MKVVENIPSKIVAGNTDWVNTARGIGIILVVYGHALRSLFPTLAQRPSWVVMQDTLIYAFHMPLFFMLSGLWLWASMAQGPCTFINKKINNILYPYFLWSIIEGGIEFFFASYVNSPITFENILMIPFVPIEQFWFLYALFFAQMTFLVIYPHRYMLPIILALSVFLPAIMPFFNATISEIFTAIFYLSIGCLLSENFKMMNSLSNAILATFSAVSWILFASILSVTHMIPNWISAPLCALTGSLGTIAIAMLLTRTTKSNLLEWLGTGSMAIYVMHTIASSGARIAFTQSGMSLPVSWILIITTLAGIGTPLVIWIIVAKFRMTRLFGFPYLSR